MAVLKKNAGEATVGSEGIADKSVYISDVHIDKNGQTWKKRAVWFRQEHLGKLKVIAHFESTKMQDLIDQALEEFVTKKLENSVAIRKLVKDKGTE